MDMLSFLRESASRFGPSGHEKELAAWLKEKFEPLCDEVYIDPLYNVIAVKKPTAKKKESTAPALHTNAGETQDGSNQNRDEAAPKVMLCAHMDEIALLVTEILKDGSLRVGMVGGVSPHILPAATVTVHTETGELFGVIGAKPPHLLTAADRKKSVKFKDLYVDLGMSAEAVKEKVAVGDLVTLHGETVELLNNRAAGKTMDDRSCIAVMLDAAERLQKIQHEAEVIFCCSVQEEVGGNGASVGSYTVAPDIAFVLDVTFASYPGARTDSTVPLSDPSAAVGPYIQPKLLQKLKDAAKKNGIKLSLEVSPRSTGTDTDEIQVSRDGVPCVLVGLPLSYMHTTVELLDMNAISECGRLAAAFISDIEEGWDTDLWT